MSLCSEYAVFPYLIFRVPHTHAKMEIGTMAKPTNFLVLGIDLSKTVAENQSIWGTTQCLKSFNSSNYMSGLAVSAVLQLIISLTDLLSQKHAQIQIAVFGSTKGEQENYYSHVTLFQV